MKPQNIEYWDGSQKLIGEFVTPPHAKNCPAVLLFPAFEGRSAFASQYAEKLAQLGFAVLIVDYYGDGRGSSNFDTCLEWYGPLGKDRALARRRACLAFKALSEQPMVDKNRIGGIGFCFGGTCLLEAIRAGESIQAAVCMHTAVAKSDLPTAAISTRLLVLQGYEDPQVPPAELAAFAQEMTNAGAKDWTYSFFGCTQHSYTDPKTGSFDPVREKAFGRAHNPIAAQHAFAMTVAFLQNNL